MTNANSAYFRQRAQHHLAKAVSSAGSIARLHRRFVQLYLEEAHKADFVGPGRTAEPSDIPAPGSPKSSVTQH